MKLRVCDGHRERTAPASLELVEEAFAQNPISDGHEIALAEGEQWIAAVAVLKPNGVEVEFLLSGETGKELPASGLASRSEALQRFRHFLETTDCRVRAGRTG